MNNFNVRIQNKQITLQIKILSRLLKIQSVQSVTSPNYLEIVKTINDLKEARIHLNSVSISDKISSAQSLITDVLSRSSNFS